MERDGSPVVEQQAQAARRLGRYEICAKLADGGMASVYLGRLSGSHGFQRWVALKVIHKHLVAEERFVEMFLDEARVSARIQHPNVCAVLDSGNYRGQPYLVMEYLHGEPLSVVARRAIKKVHTRAARPLFCRIIIEAARGLHAAHELAGADGKPMGVVHRDVSPQNIVVLYDGVSKVVDFGIALAQGRVASATRVGEVKGKFAYMSPEQLSGKAVDRRADVWSLGVVLWEATTGRRLFKADSEAGTVTGVMFNEVAKPSSLENDFPPQLEQIINAALERNPENRIQSAAELADALEAYLYTVGQPVGVTQVSRYMNVQLAKRRKRKDVLLNEAMALPAATDDVEELELSDMLPVGARPRDPDATGDNSRVTGLTTEGRSAWRLPAAVVAGLAAGVLITGAIMAAIVLRGVVDEQVAAAEPDRETSAAPPQVAPAQAPTPARVVELDAGPPTPESGSRERTPQRRRRMRGRRRGRMRRPAAAGPDGTLNLMVVPAAQVYLRGRFLGRSPLIGVSLPAGRHRLELRPVAGGPAKRIVVRIRAGERTHKAVQLQ